MAYSVKFTLDTWLKQSTALSSQISSNQLQYIDAGTELPIAAIQAANNGHIKVTFGRDPQGRQIFFKGLNSWYIYNPDVQILRDGQLVMGVNLNDRDQPSASVYVIKTVLDTWLKQSTAQGAKLPDDQRQFLNANTVLPISGYQTVNDDHLKITFGKDSQNSQIFFKGQNTWYIYRLDVQVLRDGKVILALPTTEDRSRHINGKGLQLLKSAEGLVLTAYQDAVGVWTIGYGTTARVYPGMTITQSQAEAFLKRDLLHFEAVVASLVNVFINDNQFSALVSFTYNVGESAFRDSTLLKFLNQGNYQKAANEFLRWNRAGGRELAGLTRRRQAERALFLG